MTTPIHTALAYALPQPYTLRPTTLDDAPAVAALFAASAQARGDREVADPADLRADWESPKFDLAASSRVVLDAAGAVVGIVTIWATATVVVSPFISWDVLPTLPEREAIALHLLAWGEAQAQTIMQRAPAHARFSWRSSIRQGHAPDEQIMARYGSLTPVRYFYRMQITMDAPPAALPLPAGYSLRVYQHPAELERLVAAKDEAWRDHYGYVEQPLEEVIADWRHWLETDARVDPSMWYLAIDDATGEIAGVTLCRQEDWDEPEMGHVTTVAVRRPYRRQGIAEALLRQALAEFWQRQRPAVTLYVDTSSPTGATRLYERVGMQVSRTWTQYEKLLRAGEDLMFK